MEMIKFNLKTLVHIIFVASFVSSFRSCIARDGKLWRRQIREELAANKAGSATFNVLNYGAQGDGHTDDSKGFEAAWAAACKVEASTVLIPSGHVFLLNPISFSGTACQRNIVFQLDGTITAPTSSGAWGSGLLQWIEFTKVNGITIQGTGTIDGQGSVWWKNDSPTYNPTEETEVLAAPPNDPSENTSINYEMKAGMPQTKPTALRFYGSSNVIVTGVTIQNSPQTHLKFDACSTVQVYDFSISSPGDSPNTDGIHLQNSQDVAIYRTKLACGDDCVSIQTGCSNINIHDVNCGPGHGISIGGLGKDNTKACVSNVTVRDTTMHNTLTGVRIKTWQGGSGLVQGVMFSNIQVSEVEIPIMIDQFYCDKGTCHNESSAVRVSNIQYNNIKGTYTVKPVHFACSDSFPCSDVALAAIQLQALKENHPLSQPFCWETYGELRTATVPPIDCLQVGKPSRTGTHSDADSC